MATLAILTASLAADTSFCAQAGWMQVWADEFSGTTLNTSKWTVDLNSGDSRVRDSTGTASNVYIEAGALVLRSQRETVPGSQFNFTSGAVETKDKASWKHVGGTRACVRAKLPGGESGEGKGIWPAHWMMPNDDSCWPAHGEIDIMEMINGDGTTHATYHWQKAQGGCGDKCADGSSCPHQSIGASHGDTHDASEWHEYAVEYTRRI